MLSSQLINVLYVYGLFENTDIQTKFKKRRIFTVVVGGYYIQTKGGEIDLREMLQLGQPKRAQ